MVVGFHKILIQADIELVVVDEDHVHEWIMVLSVAYRLVFKTQNLADINVTLVNFFLTSIFSAEYSYFEDAVVIVGEGKEIPLTVLDDILALNEVILAATNHFLEHFFLGLQIMLLNEPGRFIFS